MAKPVILSVDDDPDVLRAIGRDLRQEYGADYRVMRADSGASALSALKELKLTNEPVALLLVDQRMPSMTGVDLLSEATPLYPDAKRVLLTAYADTEVAIRAINDVKTHYYLLKPWDPPEQHLFPVLTDLLDEWSAGYRPAFEGIRVIGHRWSSASHDVKNFLARNQVPYEWLDIEDRDTVEGLLESAGVDGGTLPVVIFPDGATLEAPTTQQVAEKSGLKTQADSPFYDLIVVGAGPAGLAAGVYGGSEGLSTLLIERQAPGGQAGESSRIENYLGFPAGLSGADLARRAVAQVQRFGVEMLSTQEVTGIRTNERYRGVTLGDGTTLDCHALVIATGVSYRKLDVPGAEALTGAGIYYGAAMTEGDGVTGADVYIVGGANSAGQAAMYFSRFAKTVYILVRESSIERGMSAYLVDQIGATDNITVLTETQVVEAHGEGQLDSLTLKRGSGDTEKVPAKAVFIFIGAVPRTDWVGDAVARDSHGFIMSGFDMSGKNRPSDWSLERDPLPLETSLPGVFVAGDVRHSSIKRVASAVGEGSMAVSLVHRYLAEVGGSQT